MLKIIKMMMLNNNNSNYNINNNITIMLYNKVIRARWIMVYILTYRYINKYPYFVISIYFI